MNNDKNNKNVLNLLIDSTSIYYRTGINSDFGFYFFKGEENFLFVDSRYYEYAADSAFDGVKVKLYENLTDMLSEVKRNFSFDKVCTETSITINLFNIYRQKFRENGICLEYSRGLSDLLVRDRARKKDWELDNIIKAQRIAEKSYEAVLKEVKVGVSEREIAAKLDYFMKLNGAEDVSFETIVIAGANTSKPHGVPSENKVKSGDFITFDFGAVYNGYHSDTTRTVAVGCVSDKMAKVYDTVLNAQLKAIDAAKLGEKYSMIDKSARDVIADNGFGEYYKHATGHGVGLEIHEAPSVSANSMGMLVKGNVITIEPGIYIPKEFGVRIEDMLYIDENVINLTKLNKELIIL